MTSGCLYSPTVIGELSPWVVAHDEAAGGIARSFIHSWVSDGADDPVGLFLLAMVWGWGKDNRGPSNTRRMLEQEGSTDRLREIVGATRACLPIHWPLLRAWMTAQANKTPPR